jgi:hypothetical protein
MSTDFEDKLRADMGRVPVTARPGLAREAHQRNARRRHRTALAVAATGTAAAVAGATTGLALTTTSGTSQPSGRAPVETTAFVVSHVTSALATTDKIGYTSSAFTGPGLTTGVLTDRLALWAYGDLSRQLTESKTGQPLYDTSTAPESGGWRILAVSYPDRDYIDVTASHAAVSLPLSQLYSPPADLCASGVLTVGNASTKTAADWAAIITNGLKCGAFTTDGRQWVDGVDAIKLIGHRTVPQTTLWVDPGSYLPVRLTDQVHVILGSAAKQTAATLTTDFRWLPATKANLKQLTAPIPPGFREVTGQP